MGTLVGLIDGYGLFLPICWLWRASVHSSDPCPISSGDVMLPSWVRDFSSEYRALTFRTDAKLGAAFIVVGMIICSTAQDMNTFIGTIACLLRKVK